MPELTEAQHDYVATTLGVDPRRYPPKAGAGAPSAAAGGSAEAAGEAGAAHGKKFSLAVPKLPGKKCKACGNRIEIEVKPAIELSGVVSIDGKAADAIDGGELEKALVQQAEEFLGNSVEPELAKGNLWSNVKVEKGAGGFAVTSEVETGAGKFKLELTVVKVAGSPQKDGSVKVGLTVMEAKATWLPIKKTLADRQVGLLKFTSLAVSAGGEVTIAPEFKEILAKWLVEKIGEDALEEAGKVAVGAISFDAVIAGALAGVAVGVVMGSVNFVLTQIAMDKLKSELAAVLNGLQQGLREGLGGAEASGSSVAYKQGWDLGHTAYMQAIADISKQAELPMPDEIRPMAQAAAEKAFKKWPGWHEIDDRTRWAFFRKWADANHGYSTFEGDAQDAVYWCWGIYKEPADGPHMKYWANQSKLPHLLKS
jgi:hypothetical protein